MNSEKIGKHTNTWFLRGKVQKAYKVQGSSKVSVLECMRNTLGNGVCAGGESTKFIELAGKSITSGLSKTKLYTTNSGIVFRQPCNVDPSVWLHNESIRLNE